MRKYFLPLIILFAFVAPAQVRAVYASDLAKPMFQSQIMTPNQLIDAVNGLRLSYGLPPLAIHQALMQSSQSQADYMASTGQITHSRPGGLTFTQQLLTLGFPLSGDLSLGGFRSENILMSSDPLLWNGVPPAWQDEVHMNTMLSQNYTHIGAGISMGPDGYYYAVDTAAATGSGQMQESATSVLGTAPDQNSEAAGVNQYMVPVTLSTARPDGDVFHTVQYGQTLWSIAIAYGTTIKNIQALNNLGEDLVVYQGQLLLVQKGATQPAPYTSTAVPFVPVTDNLVPTADDPAEVVQSEAISTDTPTVTSTAELASTSTGSGSSRILVVILIIAAFVGAGVAVWLIRDPGQ